ncbi:MAG: EVE domain-containing protein [Gemmatimonadales bacterium]
MSNFWILKTEPSTYSFDDLRAEGRTAWDGIRNALALKHLRNMKPGDEAFIYHSGSGREIVGTASIVSEPYPDPARDDPKLVVVDISAGAEVPVRVSLATIKADPAFKDLALVRMSRLSVVPVPPEQWKRLGALAGL